jgi:hypothetical protein
MINYTVVFNNCKNGVEYTCSTSDKVYRFFSAFRLTNEGIDKEFKKTVHLEKLYSKLN